MDFLIAAIEFSIEDEMKKKMNHDQGFGVEDEGDEGRFQETTTKMIKKDDEMKMKKKSDQGFGVEDEGDQGRFQETTKMKNKKKYDQGFLDDQGRFPETTKIKKRPPPRRCHDDDDDEGSCHELKKQKRKKATRCQQYPTDLPIKFRKRITALGGSDAALVIHKCLFKTDVSSGHNRLSIPLNQIRQTFLTPQETEMLNSVSGNNNQKRCSEMEVMLIEPSLHRDTISLRKWEMKKASGSATSMYVLVGKWNSVAWRNALREDETVQLWSFRINSKLCFALVKRRARSCCFLFESSAALTTQESVPIH